MVRYQITSVPDVSNDNITLRLGYLRLCEHHLRHHPHQQGRNHGYFKGSRNKKVFFNGLGTQALPKPKTDFDKKNFTKFWNYDFATQKHNITES